MPSDGAADVEHAGAGRASEAEIEAAASSTKAPAPELLVAAGLAVDLSATSLEACSGVAERFAAMAAELFVPVREPVPDFEIGSHWRDVHMIAAMPVPDAESEKERR
jgi:hypothetical protein